MIIQAVIFNLPGLIFAVLNLDVPMDPFGGRGLIRPMVGLRLNGG